MAIYPYICTPIADRRSSGLTRGLKFALVQYEIPALDGSAHAILACIEVKFTSKMPGKILIPGVTATATMATIRVGGNGVA
jgi:hypothetical protein